MSMRKKLAAQLQNARLRLQSALYSLPDIDKGKKVGLPWMSMLLAAIMAALNAYRAAQESLQKAGESEGQLELNTVALEDALNTFEARNFAASRIGDEGGPMFDQMAFELLNREESKPIPKAKK